MVTVGSGGTAELCCFADNFISAWVSWLPHTLHSQTTATPPKTLAELGCHFFDISLLQSTQII
jgi:hypothetical protein